MIFETFVLSFLIGKFKGGKIRNLENLYIKGWYLILLSLLIEAIALLAITRFNNQISRMVIDNFFILQVIMYLLLIIGLSFNYNEKGFAFTIVGTILNFIPLALNQGKMPVSLNALSKAGLYNQIALLNNGQILTHKLMDEATKIKILGDIIPIPFPVPKVISIGDIILSLGLLIVIQKYMNISEIKN